MVTMAHPGPSASSLPRRRGLFRKVIRITAEDSPNVRRGLQLRARGLQPDNRQIIPGVLGWDEYLFRRDKWDKIRQCVGLDAQFYRGAELQMYPSGWLDHAHWLAQQLRGKPRKAMGLGCDPGEGNANTSWAVVDELGVIEVVSLKTPDTSIIEQMTVDLAGNYGLTGVDCCMDRGGGGKQIADRLRKPPWNFNIRTVAFGESVMLDIKSGMRLTEERLDNREERYAYFNRRCQMYDYLRILLNPGNNRMTSTGQEVMGFAIPAEYLNLRAELAPIPLTRDKEGRLKLLPKHKKEGSNERCLVDIIGHSPDEADAVVLAVHAMLTESFDAVAGAVA